MKWNVEKYILVQKYISGGLLSKFIIKSGYFEYIIRNTEVIFEKLKCAIINKV